jgi:hypothetical protein
MKAPLRRFLLVFLLTYAAGYWILTRPAVLRQTVFLVRQGITNLTLGLAPDALLYTPRPPREAAPGTLLFDYTTRTAVEAQKEAARATGRGQADVPFRRFSLFLAPFLMTPLAYLLALVAALPVAWLPRLINLALALLLFVGYTWLRGALILLAKLGEKPSAGWLAFLENLGAAFIVATLIGLLLAWRSRALDAFLAEQ